jgi:ABC-type uncharacterized transport system permease subunit
VVAVPLLFLAGAVAGALWILIPALLRARLRIDEVVTTLLLNPVALLLVQGLLNGPWRNPVTQFPESEPIGAGYALPRIVSASRVHLGFAVALVLALVVWVVLARTALGLRMRAAGFSPDAARFSGVGVERTLLGSALTSGAIAGMGGASQVGGLQGQLTGEISSASATPASSSPRWRRSPSAASCSSPCCWPTSPSVRSPRRVRCSCRRRWARSCRRRCCWSRSGARAAALPPGAAPACDVRGGRAAMSLLDLLTATLIAATPLLYAAIGEVVTERAGVLNLGIEGTMYAGAFVGFLVAARSQSPWLGLLAAIVVGAAAAALVGLSWSRSASTSTSPASARRCS